MMHLFSDPSIVPLHRAVDLLAFCSAGFFVILCYGQTWTAVSQFLYYSHDLPSALEREKTATAFQFF